MDPVEATPAEPSETTPTKRGRRRSSKSTALIDTPALVDTPAPAEPAAMASQAGQEPVEKADTVTPEKRRRGRPRKVSKPAAIEVVATPTSEQPLDITEQDRNSPAHDLVSTQPRVDAQDSPAATRKPRTLSWARSKRQAGSAEPADELPHEVAAPEQLSAPIGELPPQTPLSATPETQRQAADDAPPSTANNEPLAVEEGPPSTPAKRGRPRGSTKAAKAAALAAAEAAALNSPTALPTPSKRGRGRGRGQSLRGRGGRSIPAKLPTQQLKPRTGASDEESDEYVAGSAEGDDDVLEDLGVPEDTNDSYDESGSDTAGCTPKKQRKQRVGGAKARKYTYTPVDFDAKRATKQYKRWGGPQPVDRLDNPLRIDLGLDQATWSILRTMRVDRQCFEIETDRDMLALAIPTSGSVQVTMLSGSEEPLSSDKAPIKLGPHGVDELIGETTGWAANTSLSGCSVDWAPVRSDPEQGGSAVPVDFIAVGGSNPPAGSGSPATHAVEQYAAERIKSPKPGSIQIWRVDTASKTPGSCRLGMILTHTFGRCIMLKWCPVSLAPNSDALSLPIVGYLAAVFGDGYLRVCAVPHPDAFCSADGPVCVRWPKYSLAEISAPRGVFTSLAWACSDLLVAGTSSGSVTAWLLGSSIRAQHASWAARRGDRGPWPYLIPAEFFESDDCQLAPVANYPVHQGIVFSVDTYCSSPTISNAPIAIDEESDASLFTRISVSNIQVVSVSDIGRVQQTLLAFPTRHHHTIANTPSRPRMAAVYWPTANCLYGDADNCLRLTVGQVLAKSGDPWVNSEEGDRENIANMWNSPTDVSAVYALNFLGTILDISVSEFHPYIAVSSSDGSVLIQNILTFDSTSRRAPMFRKIYSLLWYPFLKQNAQSPSSHEEDEGGADEERLVCLARTPVQPRPMVPRGGNGGGSKGEDDDEG
ncbi:hypothetical protein GGI24_003907, partial [Coemansia furcata]